MNGSIQTSIPASAGGGRTDAPTSHTTSVTVERTVIHVLEMEDVLFHYNSAVMMPRAPEGDSSADGTADDDGNEADRRTRRQQEQTTGLQASALVFKTLEFYPEYRIIIAGHTDSSGGYAFNYQLAEERARNVLCLLTGKENPDDAEEEEGQRWAEICADRHRIEDYQQILTHFACAAMIPAACDPQGVDNTWGSNTNNACEAFFRHAAPDKADDLVAAVRGSSKHEWPEEAWRLVYDLYIAEMREALRVDEAGLRRKRSMLLKKFADADNRYVACGESFPIENSERNNYRSQKNRRVEILFLEDDQVPEITCPSETGRKHRTRLDGPPIECPLWHEFITRDYLDPNDLFAEAYHIRFVYNNPVTGQLANVPAGLPRIKAFQNLTTEIPTVCSFRNSIYTVRVQYPVADDPGRTTVTFSFEAVGSTPDSRLWIYTPNSSATPRIVELTRAQFDALSPEEQHKHYDLPRRWLAFEQLARYENNSGGAVSDADITGGRDRRERSKFLLSNAGTSPHFRPFGDRATSPGHPLVFCLDDILLTDNQFRPVTPASTDDSTLLDENMAVITPDNAGNRCYYTLGFISGARHSGMPEVLIPYSAQGIKAALCERRLYVVFRDRSDHNRFAGHRAAVFLHRNNCTMVPRFQQRHYRFSSGIGNFDFYLLRNFGSADGRVVSFAFAYVRWFFRDESSHAAYSQSWINTAVTNITNKWNDNAGGRLPSLIGAADSVNHRTWIRYHLEHVAEPNQHTLINVHPSGTPGRSNMGQYEGNIRADEHHADTDGAFTAAHEFGHGGVSLDDEYHERWSNCCYGKMGFVDFKPGAPYVRDRDSMMKGNMEVRSRQFWHYASYLKSRLVPGTDIAFTIDKSGDPAYTLPYNTSNSWDPSNTRNEARHYFNFPSRMNRGQTNARTGRGRFDLYRYPLGNDVYSRGGLYSGHNFTAVAVVAVNMRFNFWSRASWREIVSTLNDIEISIRQNILRNRGMKIQGTAPYQETFVFIQPRYLVNNYANGYKRFDEEIDSDEKYRKKRKWILGKPESGHYWVVNVSDPFFGTWFTDTTWDSAPHTLNLVRGDSDDYWKYFCQMLGCDHGRKPNSGNFSIASLVPGGTMHDI